MVVAVGAAASSGSESERFTERRRRLGSVGSGSIVSLLELEGRRLWVFNRVKDLKGVWRGRERISRVSVRDQGEMNETQRQVIN